MPVSDSKAMLEKSLWNPRLGICRWTSQRHALLLLVCVRTYQVCKKHPPYRASSVLVSVRLTLPIYLKDALLQVWHDLFHWPSQNMSLYSFALQIFNKCVLVELLDLLLCKETVYRGGELSFYQWCKTYHVADSILSSFTVCVDDDDDDDVGWTPVIKLHSIHVTWKQREGNVGGKDKEASERGAGGQNRLAHVWVGGSVRRP